MITCLVCVWMMYEPLSSVHAEFPTSKLEMTAVADIFDRDGDGYIDYYEFVAALHPNKDAYRPTTDADKIEDEVRRYKKCFWCDVKTAWTPSLTCSLLLCCAGDSAGGSV